VNAALDGKLDAALSLLKLQVIDAQVLAGRRLSEDMLRELLPQPRAPHQGDSALAVIQPAENNAAARHPDCATFAATMTPFCTVSVPV
jgi:hypothetical protein